MDEKILEEIKQKHLKADNTISLFFIVIDTIYFIIILVILGCGFKHFCSPKQMLFQMVLADIVYRILIIYINKFEYSLLNEIIFSFLSTLQFFLLNRILKRLFRDEYYDGGESLEIKSPYIFSAVFLVLTFTFNISKSLSILQCILAILCIFAYSYYIQSRITLFLDNLEKKNVEIYCKNISKNLTYLIAMYFVIYYGFKICNLFIENQLYYSYILMACDLFKEVAKFFLFGLMLLILNSFDKFIKDEGIEVSREKEGIY